MSNVSERTFLITGATAGIGKETAREIARTGAKVVLVGRDKAKGEQVLNEIKADTKNQNLDFLTADLSAQTDVRRLANEFSEKYNRLDVLVNNAGAVVDRRETTVDGLERTFALNHLNYFLLTNLLLDAIKQTAANTQARIVNVSSVAHYFGKIDFDDLQFERKSYSRLAAYNQSKLMNVLFTYELARRLAGTNVTANCLHPGAVASDFGKNLTGIFGIIGFLFRNTVAITPEKGAETSVYLATSPTVENVTGKYFDNKREKQSSKSSYEQDLQQRLWRASEHYVEQKF